MMAIIKGDIIASRRISNPEEWLKPLKALLGEWGKMPKQWELAWGDFVLQPKSWVHAKETAKIKSGYLYLHSLIHGALVLLFLTGNSHRNGIGGFALGFISITFHIK